MRNIFIVNATQVVTSESHPEGMFSVISGYPKTFDSRSYNATAENPNGDADKALMAAKSEYFDRLSKIYIGSETRVMASVILTMANGRTIMRESIGEFPDMTPEPEQEEQEEEPEEPVEE